MTCGTPTRRTRTGAEFADDEDDDDDDPFGLAGRALFDQEYAELNPTSTRT